LAEKYGGKEKQEEKMQELEEARIAAAEQRD